MNIKTVEELSAHYLRGGLVESYLIADFFKQCYNRDEKPLLYFWRDHTGNEVDCIFEKALTLMPIEIKAGYTINNDFFKGFSYLDNLEEFPQTNNLVVYAGKETQQWPHAQVLSWQKAGTIIK